MSWETFVCGILRLKNATDNDIILIQDYLEFGNDLEKVDIKEEEGITTIDFASVNWLSHIDDDKINKLLKKLKKKLVSYSIALYFLNEPYETWFKEGD